MGQLLPGHTPVCIHGSASRELPQQLVDLLGAPVCVRVTSVHLRVRGLRAAAYKHA